MLLFQKKKEKKKAANLCVSLSQLLLSVFCKQWTQQRTIDLHPVIGVMPLIFRLKNGLKPFINLPR